MIDYHSYLGDKVRIIDKDGDVVEGRAVSYEVGEMVDKNYDSIGIEQIDQDYIIEIPIPDIVECEVID